MRDRNISYVICKGIYKPLLKLLYRPKVYGTENIPLVGSFIFVGNHRHAFDPVLVMSNTRRTVHFMAKAELFKGLHGALFEDMGMLKVYRNQDKYKNASSMLKAEEILKNGGVLGIFPEGKRNRTEKELLEFKSGATKMARKMQVRIVPFAIRGEYKLFRKGVEIEFGKPVDISRLQPEIANGYIRNEVALLLRKQG